MVTIADVEHIFQRHGLYYSRVGPIITSRFEDETLGVGILPGGRDIVVTALMLVAPIPPAREGDVRALMDAVNRDFQKYSIPGSVVRQTPGIFYVVRLETGGASLSDELLLTGLATAVAMSMAFRPLFEAVAAGQITLQQALAVLRKAAEDTDRDMRRRIA